jgi:hypothetical protein
MNLVPFYFSPIKFKSPQISCQFEHDNVAIGFLVGGTTPATGRSGVEGSHMSGPISRQHGVYLTG